MYHTIIAKTSTDTELSSPLLMNTPVILQAPDSKHLVKHQDVYSKLAQAAHLKFKYQ